VRATLIGREQFGHFGNRGFILQTHSICSSLSEVTPVEQKGSDVLTAGQMRAATEGQQLALRRGCRDADEVALDTTSPMQRARAISDKPAIKSTKRADILPIITKLASNFATTPGLANKFTHTGPTRPTPRPASPDDLKARLKATRFAKYPASDKTVLVGTVRVKRSSVRPDSNPN
jgi:hypothetical protein